MPFKYVPPSKEFDRDLLQRIRCFLTQKGHVPLRSLEITVDQGVVLVRGRVPTFYLRQVAIARIKHVADVTQVVDLIEIVSGPGQCPTIGDSVEQEESASSMQLRLDVPDKKRAAQHVCYTQALPRQLLASRKEGQSC